MSQKYSDIIVTIQDGIGTIKVGRSLVHIGLMRERYLSTYI